MLINKLSIIILLLGLGTFLLSFLIPTTMFVLLGDTLPPKNNDFLEFIWNLPNSLVMVGAIMFIIGITGITFAFIAASWKKHGS